MYISESFQNTKSKRCHYDFEEFEEAAEDSSHNVYSLNETEWRWNTMLRAGYNLKLILFH